MGDTKGLTEAIPGEGKVRYIPQAEKGKVLLETTVMRTTTWGGGSTGEGRVGGTRSLMIVSLSKDRMSGRLIPKMIFRERGEREYQKGVSSFLISKLQKQRGTRRKKQERKIPHQRGEGENMALKSCRWRKGNRGGRPPKFL